METEFYPFNWTRIFLGLQPYGYYFEVALRILIIFGVLMVVMRLLGKRGQRNLSPVQQLLMIALGSAAGDTLLYPGVAVLYAVLILLGTTSLTLLLDWSARHWQPLRDYIDSRPSVLVRDGELMERALASERTNDRELHAALRKAGARSVHQVELAILEVTGEISVFLNDTHPPRDDLLDELWDDQEQGQRRPASPRTTS